MSWSSRSDACQRCDDPTPDDHFDWCQRCANYILELVRSRTPPASVYRYHPKE